MGIAAMDEVAKETGGEAFVKTNDITGAIRKVVSLIIPLSESDCRSIPARGHLISYII